MHFNNHIPQKILILIGLLLIAAGISFGYWIAQYDDLEQAPAPAEQYDIGLDSTGSQETVSGNVKKFTSTRYDYSIQYPKDWRMENEHQLYPPVKDFTSIESPEKDKSLTFVQSKRLGNNQWNIYKMAADTMAPGTPVYFLKQGTREVMAAAHTLKLGVQPQPRYIQDVESVLATFKFVE
jgi:hypothetical protein